LRRQGFGGVSVGATRALSAGVRLCIFFVVAGAACVDQPDLDTVEEELTAANGVNLNGVNLNGVNLNGVNLNGVNLNGVNLNGVNLNGTTLSGTMSTGTLSGTQLVGAELTGTTSDGKSIKLKFTDIDPLAKGSDVYVYETMFWTGTAWTSACGYDAAGVAIRTIPVSGRYNYGEGVPGGGSHIDDPTTFTLSCRTKGAIAKCVEIGYKPWVSTKMADYHQACTRLIRADFCGDGTPYTTNGNPVNIWDPSRIATDTEAWELEADWGPNGAVVISAKVDQCLRNGTCSKEGWGDRYNAVRTLHCTLPVVAATASFTPGALMRSEMNTVSTGSLRPGGR
jgi:hypothetical protein